MNCVSYKYRSQPSIPQSLRMSVAARVLQLCGRDAPGGASPTRERIRLSLIHEAHRREMAVPTPPKRDPCPGLVCPRCGGRKQDRSATCRQCELDTRSARRASLYAPCSCGRKKYLISNGKSMCGLCVREKRGQIHTCRDCGAPTPSPRRTRCQACDSLARSRVQAERKRRRREMDGLLPDVPSAPATSGMAVLTGRTMVCKACGQAQQVSKASKMTMCRPCRAKASTTNCAASARQTALGCARKAEMAQLAKAAE